MPCGKERLCTFSEAMMALHGDTLKKLYFLPVFLLAFGLSSKEQSKEVDELMKPYVSTNNFSGSILIARNGNVLLSKAYGPMNRSYNAPNTTQTKF